MGSMVIKRTEGKRNFVDKNEHYIFCICCAMIMDAKLISTSEYWATSRYLVGRVVYFMVLFILSNFISSRFLFVLLCTPSFPRKNDAHFVFGL